MGVYVGIDLGTTFSVISYINEEGNPVVVQNIDGARTTPSVVLFNNDNILIGAEAKNEPFDDDNNEIDYIDFIKRHMSEPSFTVTNSKGESYRPEEISALIIKKLVKDAEEAIGDKILGAVITVPAYFAAPQRQATEHAARLANLPILRIINEPTAAAYAFGLQKNLEKKQRVMVYDFGGGTFDVTILDIDNAEIKVLGTNGDHKLGGMDIDNIIIRYVINKAENQGINIESDPVAVHTLKHLAEKAKIRLSQANSAKITLHVNGQKFTVDLSRSDFEEMIEPTICTTTTIASYALSEIGIQPSELDKILLVGGSTRIPSLRTIIEDVFKIKPSSEVHPDEAVSIGAAYYAADLASQGIRPTQIDDNTLEVTSFDEKNDFVISTQHKTYKLKDVTSHAIGIITVDDEGNKFNSVIMPKNTTLPSEVVENDFSTSVPWQDALLMEVTQGDSSEIRAVTVIGSVEMKVEPRENLVPLQVVVSCDENGLIHVRAIDLDKKIDLGEIKIDQSKYNMTDEEINNASIRITKLNIGD